MFSSSIILRTAAVVVLLSGSVLSFTAVPTNPAFSNANWKKLPHVTNKFRPRITSSLRMAYEVTGDRMKLPKGSHVALITPFLPPSSPDDDLEIDYDTLRTIVRWHVESKTDALCILGTTSEASVMTMEERANIINLVMEECKGKVPIIVGTGTINPKTVIEYTKQAESLGADGVLVVTPYYVKPTPRGLISHYSRIAASSPLPIIMYNVPSRTGIDMSPETAAECYKIPGVAGIKDATGQVERVDAFREIMGEDFLLLSGDDETGAEFVLRGGDGVISVTSNVVPDVQHEIMAAANAGDREKVGRLNGPLEILHQRLFIESNPIPTKFALHQMGRVGCDACRPPLHELSAHNYEPMKEALAKSGLI